MIDDRPRRLGRLHHDPQALAQAPHLADHRFAAMAPAPAVDRQAAHSSPHSAPERDLPNSPLLTSISAKRCISGTSLCSGMLGISS